MFGCSAPSIRCRSARVSDTLGSRNDLAGAYRSAGRLDQAITLYEQTLAACERVLGSEHPTTNIARDNLAAARRLRSVPS